MANASNIAAVLKQAVDSGDVPGVVAAAATRDGPIFEGGFGKRALPAGEPMTVDTVVWIASMTKAITSACAMQQVERGKLSLDAPIETVLPELANPLVLEGFDADGNPKTLIPPAALTTFGAPTSRATSRKLAHLPSFPARTPRSQCR